MEDGRCVQSCSSGYYLDHSTENGYKSCKRYDQWLVYVSDVWKYISYYCVEKDNTYENINHC